jgi:hypothetical protein
MRVFRQSLIDRVNLAVMQAPGIMVGPAELAEAPGFTEAFLADLGVSQSDLKRLERWGLAKRGYAREKAGWRKKWVLINPNKESSSASPSAEASTTGLEE